MIAMTQAGGANRCSQQAENVVGQAFKVCLRKAGSATSRLASSDVAARAPMRRGLETREQRISRDLSLIFQIRNIR
jgi:predicted aldo/keto reductase-like oxidoreductase